MRVLPIFALVLAACSGPETTFSQLTPELAVNPESVDFGEISVPFGDVAEVFVTNAGRGTLDFTARIEGGEGAFQLSDLSAYTLEPDESQTLTILFEPLDFPVDYAANLVIESNDDDNAIYPVPLLGKGVDIPKPDIEVKPLFVDFGTVAPGDDETEFVEVKNVGNADLHLGSVSQEGAGSFFLDFDPSFVTVTPGESVAIIVSYFPPAIDGDSGTILIPSDDEDEPVVEVELEGNDGGDGLYPDAVIDCPTDGLILGGEPLALVLDGSDSVDPSGLDLTYQWVVGRSPDGSLIALADDTSEAATVTVDLAGLYEIRLQVTNSDGVSSVPAKCPLNVLPEDDFRVELTWDTERADLDLHLLQNDGELFSDDDVCWCNPNPEWGGSGEDDNPSADIDDPGGLGPENTNLRSPADGEYTPAVHYYDDHGDGAVVARLKVWVLGSLAWEGTQTLQRNEVWTPGYVNWPEGSFAINVETLTDAGINRQCSVE